MTCRWVAATAALVIALGACRDGDQKTDVRTLSADELARQGKLTLGDSQVVLALRAPQVAGRIIYDPPVDLSLSNAMRTRRFRLPSDASSAPSNSAEKWAGRSGPCAVSLADGESGACESRDVMMAP